MSLGDVAAAFFGRGLFAGAAGTAAMTVSSSLEARLRGRGASTAPARAAEKVLGVKPVSEEAEARFSNLAHWGYGTGWGGVRGLLGDAGLSGPKATATHFAAVWGTSRSCCRRSTWRRRSPSEAPGRSPSTPCATSSTPRRPALLTPC
jgi:hypothetical protein